MAGGDRVLWGVSYFFFRRLQAVAASLRTIGPKSPVLDTDPGTDREKGFRNSARSNRRFLNDSALEHACLRMMIHPVEPVILVGVDLFQASSHQFAGGTMPRWSSRKARSALLKKAAQSISNDKLERRAGESYESEGHASALPKRATNRKGFASAVPKRATNRKGTLRACRKELRMGRARLQACRREPPRNGHRSAEGWSEGAAEATDLLPLPLGPEPQKLKSPKKPANSHVKP